MIPVRMMMSSAHDPNGPNPQVGKLQTEQARMAVRVKAARESARGAEARMQQLQGRITATEQEDEALQCGTLLCCLAA
jgi:hypothetical protein